MDKKQINDLIWGNFESEIIEMEIPLSSFHPIMKTMAMDGAFALFNGFLTYLMFKLGYKPKLSEEYKEDMDDNSWWLKYLDDFGFMGLSYSSYDEIYRAPPFIFKEFFNENEIEISICLLLDWYSFYEINLALNKSKLDDESKYTHKLFSEIKTRNIASQYFLDYMKNLHDMDFAKSHNLVLRPDKLLDFIVSLDEQYLDYEDFPNDVYTNEELNKMSKEGQIVKYGKDELVFCNEDNFRQLLETASIKIPNVKFVTFPEFIEDKLVTTIKDWTDIRDRYILRLKNILTEPDPPKNFDKAKKLLQYAKNSLENNIFAESIRQSSIAIEYTLSTFLDQPNLRLAEQIKKIESNQDFRNRVVDLQYIRNVRNRVVHSADFEVTEDIARHVFEMSDQFLADIQTHIRKNSI